jgi:AraC-like DNA-binding protein
MQFKGCVSLFKIQTDLNLSERTFERRFEQQVGLSPRLLASISQFQTSLQQLKEGKFTKLSDIAYDNGYADQSHFIRSFKKFTNLSPLQFIKQSTGVSSPDSFDTE